MYIKKTIKKDVSKKDDALNKATSIPLMLSNNIGNIMRSTINDIIKEDVKPKQKTIESKYGSALYTILLQTLQNYQKQNIRDSIVNTYSNNITQVAKNHLNQQIKEAGGYSENFEFNCNIPTLETLEKIKEKLQIKPEDSVEDAKEKFNNMINNNTEEAKNIKKQIIKDFLHFDPDQWLQKQKNILELFDVNINIITCIDARKNLQIYNELKKQGTDILKCEKSDAKEILKMYNNGQLPKFDTTKLAAHKIDGNILNDINLSISDNKSLNNSNDNIKQSKNENNSQLNNLKKYTPEERKNILNFSRSSSKHEQNQSNIDASINKSINHSINKSKNSNIQEINKEINVYDNNDKQKSKKKFNFNFNQPEISTITQQYNNNIINNERRGPEPQTNNNTGFSIKRFLSNAWDSITGVFKGITCSCSCSKNNIDEKELVFPTGNAK